jgi:hypothetical protein
LGTHCVCVYKNLESKRTEIMNDRYLLIKWLGQR